MLAATAAERDSGASRPGLALTEGRAVRSQPRSAGPETAEVGWTAVCTRLPTLLVLGAGVLASCGGRVQAPNDRCRTPTPSFRAVDATVLEVVALLRKDHRIPVNFIACAGTDEVRSDFEGNSVGEILQQVVLRDTRYELELDGQTTVFPAGEGWDDPVPLEPTAGPRVEVARALVSALQRRESRFGGLLPPAIKGDPRSSLYADPVSLGSGRSPLDHLADLLGAKPTLVFSIEPTRSGDRLLVFCDISEIPQHPRGE